VPATLGRAVDLLFIVDNSNSMFQEQENLTRNFPRFMEVLRSLPGGLPDLHIGITTTDLGAGAHHSCSCGETEEMHCPNTPGGPPYVVYDPEGDGDNGALVVGNTNIPPAGNCGIQPSATVPNGNFLSDVADGVTGARVTNYTGELADVFACAASVGTGGCGFERPLEAMKRAFENPRNAGFLRDDAVLGVVILSDEDDCSADEALFDPSSRELDDPLGPLSSYRCFEHGVTCDQGGRSQGARTSCTASTDDPYFPRVQEYVDFLRARKADPNRIVVGQIVGIPQQDGSANVIPDLTQPAFPQLGPTCSDPATGEAAPAFRLRAFADGFRSRSSLSTICNQDLSDSLFDIAETVKRAIGNPCLTGTLVDKNQGVPGIQPACSVTEIRSPSTPARTETALPECRSGGPTPCWHLAQNADHCSAYPSQLELVVERGGASVPGDTLLHIECAVE